MAAVFQVGDRVQTTRDQAGLGCGRRGTICQVFPAGDFYYVRFDTKPVATIGAWSGLAAAAPALQARAVGDG